MAEGRGPVLLPVPSGPVRCRRQEHRRTSAAPAGPNRREAGGRRALRRGAAGVKARNGFVAWLDDRTGFSGILRRLLEGRVERRGAWLRTTGVACLMLVAVEAVSGTILGLYYAPSPGEAYANILAIEANPLSRFPRGLHHWS